MVSYAGREILNAKQGRYNFKSSQHFFNRLKSRLHVQKNIEKLSLVAPVSKIAHYYVFFFLYIIWFFGPGHSSPASEMFVS